MATTQLDHLPADILLLLCTYIRPEDCFSLIQTCKHLHGLSMFKAFWIQCAMNLQRRRRVHRLPLQQLSIPELRTSVIRTLRLDIKWRVGGNDDPRPIRRIELEAAKYCPSSMEKQAVTWAWFLDDGIHIVCVIDDKLIQLWHLPTNKPVFIVKAGGRLVRASKFIDQKYFILVASTLVESVDDDYAAPNRFFKVWRYEWGTDRSHQNDPPFIEIPIPVDATFTFITQEWTGFIFVQNERTSLPLPETNSGNLNIWILSWGNPSKILRCYTPLAAFGEEHAEQCQDDTFRMTRFSNRLIMHFETTYSVDGYFYDLASFSSLFEGHATLIKNKASWTRIDPEHRITYSLAVDGNDGLPSDTRWATWGDSSLWDGKRLGLLSQNVKMDRGCWIAVIALSILDPDTAHLVDSGVDGEYGIRRFHAEFTRPVVYVRPEDYKFSKTSDYHALVSQPAASKSVVWALTHENSEQQIQALVLTHFPSEDCDEESHPSDHNVAYDGYSTDTRPQVPELVTEPEASNDQPESTHLKPKGDVLMIDITDWIPPDETTEDIDLDDVYGRVALGMKSGKVMILEFV